MTTNQRVTLALYFTELRTNAGLSLRAVGQKAKPKLDAATVWKIESGKKVKAKTLGLALRALDLTEKDHAFVEAFALWSTEQAQTLPFAALDGGIERVKASGNREFDKLVAAAAAALRKAPEADRPLIVEALKHPAALALWVRSRK